MCEAEEKWKKELYDAGYAKGYAEGYAEGLIKGKILGLVERVIEALKEIDSKWRDGDLKEDEEKGRFIGRLEMFVELTKRMMTKSDMTLDDAMARLGLTDDEKNRSVLFGAVMDLSAWCEVERDEELLRGDGDWGRGGTRCGALARRWGIGGEVERDAELLRGDRLGLRARCRGDKNCQFWAETD